MIYKNSEIGLSLNIDDTLLNTLIDVGKKHYPNEFGGFLIGNYSDDFKQLNVTDTLLPKKYKATKYLFERSTKGIKKQLLDFYAETPKKYYVGEWHTHPDNLPVPSHTDFKAMKGIVNHKEVTIKNPVLLIIGYNQTDVEIGFYVLFEEKLYKYDKNIF